MQLEQSFDVQAPIDLVWRALIDVEQVAPCMPGASITGRAPDGTYTGAFSVKIGPAVAAYSGKLEMTDVDEAAHSATMRAHGADKRGQGGVDATIKSKLTEASPGSTHVVVNTDYRLTGRLARFGRGGMIEDASGRLLAQFAACLQESLAARGRGTAGAGIAPGDARKPQPVATPATGEASSAPTSSPEPLDVASLVRDSLLARARQNALGTIVVLGFVLLLLRRRRR